jgi:uncharacterized protein
MKILLGLFIGMGISSLLHAQQGKYHKEIPDIPTVPGLVQDLGDMLSSSEEDQLENKLYQYEKQSSNEIAVVTVTSLGDLEIADFATELGRKWDIGKASKRNGVLLLIAKNDRELFIAPADRLQGALTDVECWQIIDKKIVPQFRAGYVYEGINVGTTAIMEAIAGEFTNDGQGTPPPVKISTILILLLFMALLIFLIARKSKRIYVSRRGYRYGDDDQWFGGGFGGGSWGGGFGGGSSGGGGFGGFGGGGGGFDGGGAGGSW